MVSTTATALSCDSESDQQEFLRNDFVFEGIVENIEDHGQAPSTARVTDARTSHHVEFSVKKVWKGKKVSRYNLPVHNLGRYYDMPFTKGGDYVVFAKDDAMKAGNYFFPVCGRFVDLSVNPTIKVLNSLVNNR